jgi:hypothetical protein
MNKQTLAQMDQAVKFFEGDLQLHLFAATG